MVSPTSTRLLQLAAAAPLLLLLLVTAATATTEQPASHNHHHGLLTDRTSKPIHDHGGMSHDHDMRAADHDHSAMPGYSVGNGSMTTELVYVEEKRPKWKEDLDFVTTIILTGNTINLMLGMGAATYWREVVNHTWPPTGIVIGMVGQFILLPAVGSFLSYVFNLTKYEAMGVLMVSCSPGGSFSNFFTFWCDGDLALSIVMTTFSSVLAFGGMPFNLWMYSKIWIDPTEAAPLVIPYSSIMTALVFITVPVAIGMVIRHFNQKVARIITQIASIFGWIGCLLVLVIWLILYWKMFVDATPLIYVSAFLLPVLGFAIAYALALVCCRSHKVCRTIGIETGSQNMVVALSIILLSFKEPEIKGNMLLFPTLYGVTLLIEMFLGIGLFHVWKKYFKKSNDDDYFPEALKATVEKGNATEKESLKVSHSKH